MMLGRLLCRLGLHDDATDVMGGYSVHCVRPDCGKRLYGR